MLRVATWNIHRCVGRDKQFSPERILDVLKTFDADVIALQELESVSEGGLDLLARFSDELGMESISGPTMYSDLTPYGNAVLVKGSITHTELVDLTYKRREPRGAIVADITVKGIDVTIMATHFGLKFPERLRQLHLLSGALIRERKPYQLLMGDFNEWRPHASTLKIMRKQFKMACDKHGATFPSAMPIFKLDRIFFNDAFTSSETVVIDDKKTMVASDHLPIIAILQP